MIPRYARPEMVAIWEPQTRYSIWLEIETLAAEAMAELGMIPKEVPIAVRARGGFNVERIDEIEREVKHDVIAFLTSVAEHVGEEARFLHMGMTSSDVLDTCLAVQLQRASDILLKDIDRVLAALKKRALEHKMTPTIGRSHGIHAEPTTFGVKLAGFYAEMARNRKRLCRAQRRDRHLRHLRRRLAPSPTSTRASRNHGSRKARPCCRARLDPGHPARPSRRLTSRHSASSPRPSSASPPKSATCSAQKCSKPRSISPKGRRAHPPCPTSAIPCSPKISPASPASCAHAVVPAMENVALWHERDISHSSVERGIGPDATIHLDFALNRLAGVIENLLVYPENMLANLNRSAACTIRSACCSRWWKGREPRGRLSHGPAQRDEGLARRQPQGRRLPGNLVGDADVSKLLTKAELGDMFDLGYHFKGVDTIFRRVFGQA
jgi:adenylosuccinate lyase